MTGTRGTPPADRLRTLLRGIGQTLITCGLVVLLFLGYQLYLTDIPAAREQDRLTEELRDQWAGSPPADAPTVTPEGAAPSAPAPAAAPAPEPRQAEAGRPLAVLHIPRLGADYSPVVVEGTSRTALAGGPGHYRDTALPGEDGNFAVAGHRVGRGSPFLDLDRLRPGDAIVVETAGTWFTYRVLGDAATGDVTADPSGIPGRTIVEPTAVEVLAPTPGASTEPASGAYLTLTTCHPKYSARQRLVIHARLDGAPLGKASAPDGPPALDV